MGSLGHALLRIATRIAFTVLIRMVFDNIYVSNKVNNLIKLK
jgi:hypothetical protein